MDANRCLWATANALYAQYHDAEWGVPVRGDDRKLYEFLIMEQMQAGFSRLMVLQKRENFRQAFDQFDPEKVAKYDAAKLAQLMSNEGIIRHGPKINAVVNNAKAILRIQEEFGSFDAYVWSFVSEKPIQNAWKTLADIPKTSKEAEALSKDLLKRKFKLVNPAICYTYMQAIGMVNDHTVDCFRHTQIAELS